MPQKLNKKIIIPAVLIGGGIALYFLNKSGKLDKLKNLIKGKEKEVIETTSPVAPVITSQTTVVTSNPLGNAAAVKKFQEYYNLVKPANLPALTYDGWGPLTAAAYNSYKDKYAAAAAAGKLPATTTTTTITPLTALKIGDKVNAIILTATYPGYTLTNPYTAGGTDGNGNYQAGNYVGVITSALTGNAIKVRKSGSPFPEIDDYGSNTTIGDFWVRASNITKSLI